MLSPADVHEALPTTIAPACLQTLFRCIACAHHLCVNLIFVKDLPVSHIWPAVQKDESGHKDTRALQSLHVACVAVFSFVNQGPPCSATEVFVLQELYPLTLALEKEGAEGADLQQLQLAAHMQLVSRSACPSVPPGSRTKAGRTRPLRTWRQE